MHSKTILRDFHAISLFVYAEFLAFVILMALNGDNLETKAYYMLLIFTGGLVCHTMVRAVHAIYGDNATVTTTAAGPA